MYMSSFTNSAKFDYDSIMIYDSIRSAPTFYGPFKESGPWMTRKADGQDTGELVWQGGNSDAGKAKLSAGDIARVAQLYQRNDAGAEQLRNLADWGPR